MQGQRPFDGNQAGQQPRQGHTWQDQEQDRNDRQIVKKGICELTWASVFHLQNKLPELSIRFEDKLYWGAESKAHYMDMFTLQRRLRWAVAQIIANPQDVGLQACSLQPLYGQQAGQQAMQGHPWQDQDQDLNDRKSVLDEIYKFYASSLSHNQYTDDRWLEPLLHFTLWCDEKLYRSAQSKAEYLNLSTLQSRFPWAAVRYRGIWQDPGYFEEGQADTLLAALAGLTLAEGPSTANSPGKGVPSQGWQGPHAHKYLTTDKGQAAST